MGERAFEEEANEEDLRKMVSQLRESIKAGAMGFTTSISVNHATSDDRPVASRLAHWDEIEALVLRWATQSRDIRVGEPPSPPISHPEKRETYISRLVDLAVRTGVPITYGMLATGQGDNGWKPVIELLDRINNGGGRSWGQVHTRYFGVLLSFATRLPFDALPMWDELRTRSLAEQRAALADSATRSQLVQEANQGDYGRSIGAETRKPEWEHIYPMEHPRHPFDL